MKQLLFVAMVAACGGGGGVDQSQLLGDMTDAEVTDECTFLYDNYPAKTTDCGGGNMTTTGQDSVSACEKSYDDVIDHAPNCKATVGEAEDCIADFYAAPCAGSLPASCGPIFNNDCVVSSARRLVESVLRRSPVSR